LATGRLWHSLCIKSCPYNGRTPNRGFTPGERAANSNRHATITRPAAIVTCRAKMVGPTRGDKSTQWTCRKEVRMTKSQGSLRLRGASSPLPERFQTPRFSTSLVGWLIQTAVISVIRETCETYSESRGSSEGVVPAASSPRGPFPLKSDQRALLSRALGQKSKLFSAGYVAGDRRTRRANPK
jgi:hypothetical protein